MVWIHSDHLGEGLLEMMDKLLLFEGKNERGIFTYLIDAEKSFLEKTASEYNPQIASYINAAKPINGKTQILLTALGAGEWWGNNVNGDYFPELSLAHDGDDYGYKTFELYAKAYKHHVNKDPNKAYGDVALSVYNPVYHRVELIVVIDNAKAPDIASDIENGVYPDWSMGCKVPFDICNICGNKAPNRTYYCEHLKYYMGRIVPSLGKMAYAINTKPKFFDISRVLIGADRIAKTLQKVAAQNPWNLPIVGSAHLAEKSAARFKKAEIEKEIPADGPPASEEHIDHIKELANGITEVKAREPLLPRSVLDYMSTLPLGRSMSTMFGMGMLPKPIEFQRIYLVRNGHRDLADKLDSLNASFDPMSGYDYEPKGTDLAELSLGDHDDRLITRLKPHLEERSYAAPYLGRRVAIMIKCGAKEHVPYFIKVGKEDIEKAKDKPSLLRKMLPLAMAALAYRYLVSQAPKEAVTGVHKILSSNMGLGLAAASGLAAMNTFDRVVGPKRVGQFIESNAKVENPDASDIFSHIEEIKQKPIAKLAGYKGSLGGAAKRLFLGVPAAYMASGVLQKHRELSPDGEEGRIRKFIRTQPELVSAALIADAVLTGKGHPMSSAAMMRKAQGLGSWAASKFKQHASPMFSKKFAGRGFSDITTSDEEAVKLADALDTVSNTLVWPLIMGKTNLASKVVGSVLDQALISGGSKLLKKKNEANPTSLK